MNSSGDITIGCLQCEHDLPGPVECKPFIGDGGAGDVAADVFEFLALMGSAAHLGMEACRRDPVAGGATQALHAPLRREHRHRAAGRAGESVPSVRAAVEAMLAREGRSDGIAAEEVPDGSFRAFFDSQRRSEQPTGPGDNG
jgi:hypothetical protein